MLRRSTYSRPGRIVGILLLTVVLVFSLTSCTVGRYNSARPSGTAVPAMPAPGPVVPQ